MHEVGGQGSSAFAWILSGLRASFNWSVQITCFPTKLTDVDSDDEHLGVKMAGAGAHAADVQFLVRRSMTKGYELFSLLTPPAYAAFVLARKGRAQFSINHFLRATWVGGAVGKLLRCPSAFFSRSFRLCGWRRLRICPVRQL